MNDLWNRFWLWLFRDLCPEPRPWAKLEITMETLKTELGECLAPTMEQLSITITDMIE